MDDETTVWKALLLFFVIIFFICALVEVGILLYAFFTADKIECNGIMCSFTTIKGNVSQDCFSNGERINCSDINIDYHDLERW